MLGDWSGTWPAARVDAGSSRCDAQAASAPASSSRAALHPCAPAATERLTTAVRTFPSFIDLIGRAVQYVNHQGKKFHKECYNVDVKCGRCNKPVFGEVVQAIDKHWCALRVLLGFSDVCMCL